MQRFPLEHCRCQIREFSLASEPRIRADRLKFAIKSRRYYVIAARLILALSVSMSIRQTTRFVRFLKLCLPAAAWSLLRMNGNLLRKDLRSVVERTKRSWRRRNIRHRGITLNLR